jgi:hypothetical protein
MSVRQQVWMCTPVRVVAGAVGWATGQVFSQRLVPTVAEVPAWVRALPGSGVTYGADPTGFGRPVDDRPFATSDYPQLYARSP